MVNFKASGHQGEHKRALAAQGEGDTAQQAVSKLEKMKLRPDAACVNANGVALRVGAREKMLGGESNAHVKAALVAPGTLAKLGAPAGASRALLCRPGGDVVLSARESAEAEEGAVLLGEAQRLSLHVCEDESYEWLPFETPAPDSALASLAIEAQASGPCGHMHILRMPKRMPPCACPCACTCTCTPLADGVLVSPHRQLLTPPNDGESVTIDALMLSRELGKRLFDELVSDNEIFMYEHRGIPLVLRVTGTAFPEVRVHAHRHA